MRKRIFPVRLLPALLGAVLAFAATAPYAAQDTATSPTVDQPQTTTTAPATTTSSSSTLKTDATCTNPPHCVDASGTLRTCKIVNSIPKWNCANPVNICSGACY